MGNLIRISTRRNLFYVVNVIIYYYIRKIDSIIINKVFNFNNSLIFTFLMLTGEFFAGLSIYIYQILLLKKDIKTVKYFKIIFTTFKPKMKRSDNIFKIGLLLFFSASFDFVTFIIGSFFIPKFPVVSKTADYRFGGLVILLSALLCHFNLRIKILKHQFYSLLIIGICLSIIIILEIIFRVKEASIGNFCFGYMLVIANSLFISFTDAIEKYLMEFDYLSPFLIIMIEAIFGFIFIFIFSIREPIFNDLKKLYIVCSTGNFILLIFLLFLYFAFSAGVNVYKILTTGLYSPMAKTLAGYILNPFLYIYYFSVEKDFFSRGERNWFYFIMNVIIGFIISFFGCVFDEFLVLKCFGLEHETHFSISIRADTSIEQELESIDNRSSNPN